jgi:sulfite exporter TauE/SafE
LKRALLKFEALKTFGGTAVGGIMLVAGWSIYTNNGYNSALVFFVGLVLLPVGLYALAGAVTGQFGETPRNIVASYRQHLKAERKTGQA